MAIVKTTFTGETKDEQYEQLLSWIQSAGADYFTTIEGNSDNHRILVGKQNEAYGRITLMPNSELTNMAALYLGSESTYYMSNSTGSVGYTYGYGVTTSKGFYLRWGPTNQLDSISSSLCVSKTNTGDTFLVFRYYGTNGYDGHMGMVNLDGNSIYPDLIWDGDSPYYLQGTSSSTKASYTVLTPFSTSSSDVYCPNIFALHFNQFCQYSSNFNTGILTLNSKNYFTDNFIALAD